MRGLVSGRGRLSAAESGRPATRFDKVVDQPGHVVLGTRCRVAEFVSNYSRHDHRSVLVRIHQRASAVRFGHAVPPRCDRPATPSPVRERTDGDYLTTWLSISFPGLGLAISGSTGSRRSGRKPPLQAGGRASFAKSSGAG